MSKHFNSIRNMLMGVSRFILTLSSAMTIVSISDGRGSNIFFRYSIKDTVFLLLLCCGFLYLSTKKYKESLKSVSVIVLSCFIGIDWVISEAFMIDNTLGSLKGSWILFVEAIVYCIGAVNLIYLFVCLFVFLLEQKKFESSGKKKSNIKKIDKGKIKLFCSIFLFLMWIIPIIMCYPGNMCGDAWSSLNRYWSNNWNMNQPPAYTLYLGILTSIGKVIGNTGFGLYLNILIQFIIYLYVCTKSIEVIYILSESFFLTGITAIIMGITPYYSNRVSVVMKDCIYSVFVLLLMVDIVIGIVDIERFLLKKRNIVEISAAIIGIILTRKNGIYIILPLALVSLFICIRSYTKFSKKMMLRACYLCLVPISVGVITNSIIVNKYNVREGNIGVGEVLSLPFQQTARCVLENKNYITEDERAAIDKVLEYDQLEIIYNPLISDRVKATYKIDTVTYADLKRYFVVWGRLFFKYPLSYVRATANQFYMLFYPFLPNDKVYIGFANGREDVMQNVSELSGLDIHEKMGNKDLLRNYYLKLYHLPIFSIFCQQAVYILIFLILLVLGILNRMKAYIYVNIPMIISFLIILAGPAIQGHPRYAFPIIYSVPVLVAFYMYLYKLKCAEESIKQ